MKKVLVSIMVVGVMLGTLSLGCVIGNQRQLQQEKREVINQIRLSNGYILKN